MGCKSGCRDGLYACDDTDQDLVILKSRLSGQSQNCFCLSQKYPDMCYPLSIYSRQVYRTQLLESLLETGLYFRDHWFGLETNWSKDW